MKSLAAGFLLTAALGVGSLAQEPAPPSAEIVDLVLPGGKQRLRLELHVEGPAPAATWEAFLDRWFDYFDRDGDGTLSRAEAGRIFALPLPGGKSAAFDFGHADTNGDGKITRAEMRAYYTRASFTPVLTVVRPATLEDVRVAEALFRHLGPDRGGLLSAEKLKRASDLLTKLDENEDEVLTVAEVLSLGVDASRKSPTAGDCKWAAADKQLSPPVLSFVCGGVKDPASRIKSVPKAIEIIAGTKDAAAPRLRHGDVVLAISSSGADPAWAVSLSRQFVLAQFKSAAGSKQWLEKRHVEDDASLQIVAALFDDADRNGDGKLTLDELEKFLALVEQGVGCCLLITLQERGRNLFALWDADGDGRLDLHELRAAAGMLPAKKAAEGWSANDVPHFAQIIIQRGFAGAAFGPVPLVSASQSTPAAPVGKGARGPAWFRAMDRNGDGFVSASEFLGPPELFRQLDLNGDGLISAEEAMRAGAKRE
jgi:Ca2+-binding EF-hand superfamily protein